jgi:hypothetical protein
MNPLRRRLAAIIPVVGLTLSIAGCSSWFFGKTYQYQPMQNPQTDDEVGCWGQYKSGGLFSKGSDTSKDECVMWYTQHGYEKE